MKVQELDPKEVKFNPMIAARAGDLDKENVADIAQSFVTRRQAGLLHQIQPGVVRSKDNAYEVIVGRHRLAAAIEANTSLAKGEEPFLFNAIVVRDGDEAALVTAITENEKRKSSTIFDRGDAMQRLLDLGKTQDQVADIYGIDKSTVSQTLAAAKLPSKLKKMVLNGDMEQDAALLLGSFDDTTTRQEIIEQCIANRNFYDEMEERLAAKGKEAGNGKGKKAAASDEEPEPEVGARTAKKGVKKSKVKKEDVARAAKSHPAAKSSRAAQTSSTMSRKQFFSHLEAMYENKENPLPKAARTVISRIEGFYDGEITPAQFCSALVKCCLPDAA